MKKGNTLLIVLSLCICFLVGIFIGRSTTSHHIFPPFNDALFETPAAPAFGLPGNGTVDLNTATAEQLMLLPGIGEKLSKNIIQYREENGPFTQVEDLLLVEGISTSTFTDVHIYLSVGGNYENSGS